MAASNSIETDFSEKVIIITGGNTGIGYETVLGLAKLNANLIMACRDKKRSEVARDKIIEITKNQKVSFEELDLASLQSIRSFVKIFREKWNRLDILINNAGVFLSEYTKTSDGFEAHFGINHLGHFLLTNLLIDLLEKTASSRIINVSSELHRLGSIHWDDINIEKNYGIYTAYSQSKYANVLFTIELNKRFKESGLTAVAVDPGLVNTEITRNYTGVIASIQKYFAPYFAKTAEQGASISLYCATATNINSGDYYNNSKPTKLSEKKYPPEDANRLWELSAKMTQLGDLRKT